VEESVQPNAPIGTNLLDGGSVAEILEARAGLPDAFHDRVELWRPAPPPTPSPPIRRLRRPIAGRTPGPSAPAEPEPSSPEWDVEELPDHDYEAVRHQPSWGRVQDLDLEGIGELERSPEASGEIDL